MRRRDFIVVLAGSAAALPFVVCAQQTRPAKLGVLLVEKREPFSRVFSEGLREFGYISGQNMQIEYRSADGRSEERRVGKERRRGTWRNRSIPIVQTLKSSKK